MTYARDEAIRLITWILDDLGPNESVCLELPFRDVRRKADIAILSNNRLSAIEVKGQRDNTQKLTDQINDYSDMFLDVSVATAPKHLARIRELAPKRVGIILLGEDSVELVRKPTRRHLLPKENAANWLGRLELDDLLGRQTVRAIGVVAARELALRRFSAEVLTRAAMASLAIKNEDRFAAFQQERGRVIDLDDIHMLSLQSKVRQ